MASSVNQTPATFWAKLESTQLLLVEGTDASKFLQGQVTCDIRELRDGATRIGAQCNPKGRVLLSFRALQFTPEKIALRIPVSMRTIALQNLGKYIIFSKATLSSGEDGFQLFGIYGESASNLAMKLFTTLPSDNGNAVESDGNILIRLDGNRYECWIQASKSEAFIQHLSHLATQVLENEWTLLDIRAGIASIYPETVEALTPQEINYQLINAISFRKGCYTGQEIVARLHYRGKLKRHLYRFSLTTNILPPPGTAVINNLTQQTAGQVVMAAKANSQEIELLVSTMDEHLHELVFVTGEQKLKPLPLPYAIPTADENAE